MIYETSARPQADTREKQPPQAWELRGDGTNVSTNAPEMETGTAAGTQPTITTA